MAGDWIKMRTNLWDDPRINGIVDAIDSPEIGEATVIGAVYWLWSAADQHSEDGFMPGLSLASVDRKTGVKGISSALVSVGWLEEVDGGLQIPNFDDHNGMSAKKRCQDASRKAKVRNVSASQPDKKRTGSDKKRTLTGAREREEEEKKREEKKEPPPPPTPSAAEPADLDPSGDWEAVAVELISSGVKAPGVLKNARKSSFSPAEVLLIIGYFKEHSEQNEWGPGALVTRLRDSEPGWPIDHGWPAEKETDQEIRGPDPRTEDAQRQREETLRTKQENDQALQFLETKHGLTLDQMNEFEIQELAESVSPTLAAQVRRDQGAIKRPVRQQLLRKLDQNTITLVRTER